jgi:hypothetical protein
VAWHHQRNLKAMANESVFNESLMKTLALKMKAKCQREAYEIMAKCENKALQNEMTQ